MSLRQNVFANYGGQGWVAVMGLAFVPLYIHYLGMEAFGLIGLMTMLQSWLTLLDMGLTPTLNREMARFAAGMHTAQGIHDLLRSLEGLALAIAGVLVVVMWCASDYLANDWLHSSALPAHVTSQALAIIGVIVALRLCEGLYKGSLFGLQRQVWFNVVNAALATSRHAGSVLVLAFVSPTIQAFFWWQAFISVLSLLVFKIQVHRVLPKPPSGIRFSLAPLRSVRAFAGGMFGIALLSILLTQVDKVLLSRMLSLEEFGFYTLAATLAAGLYLVIVPTTQAYYPRMVELVSREDEESLVATYHQAAQLVAIMTTPTALMLMFFGEKLILIWSNDASLAARTAPLLMPLALGTYLNGMMHVPYQLQLAHGWTAFTLKINVVAVSILVPAILVAVPRYGALGAAWIWVVLNSGYVLMAIHFMHMRLLPKEKWAWYGKDVIAPALGAGTVCGLLSLPALGGWADGRLQSGLQLAAMFALATLTAMLCSGHLRSRLAMLPRLGLCFSRKKESVR